MSKATIAAGFVRTFLDFAVSRGGDRPTLIERSHIRPEDLKDDDNRISLAKYIALMRVGIELCKEPALALLSGEAARLQDVSIVGLLGRAESAEQARQQANRYGRLAIDDGRDGTSDRIEFVQEGDAIWMMLTSDLYRDNPLLTESTFARLVYSGRAQSNSHNHKRWPPPKAIRFTHDEPSYRSQYDRIFRIPIQFGSHMNAIMFDRDLLSVRLPQTNRYVSRLLTDRADLLLERLESSQSLRGRVEGLLIPMLNSGQISIEMIARKLSISRQTLFRRLKAEGVTFEKVLDELRKKMALRYLNDGKVPVNEVAYLVGFSEPAAFSRAFKRWTGSSPGAMRAGRSAPSQPESSCRPTAYASPSRSTSDESTSSGSHNRK